MIRDQLMQMLTEREEEMIALRRHFHEHPELSFQEKNTADYIAAFYDGKDVEVKRNVGNGYGIVVTIRGKKPGRTVALRADFDALEIEEATGLPFASKNDGVMHACGHDGHTAYLMILADSLAKLKADLPGTVKIVHQNAEELGPGGAKSIVESGELDDVDEIYGIHFYPNAEVGVVEYADGWAYAGCSEFSLHIQGKGGHGSMPHMSNDAIVAASSYIMNLQTVVSRRIDPFDMAVVTVGSFKGAGATNVIKDNLTIEGDARYMDIEVGRKIEQEMRALARGLEESFGVKCTFEFHWDYPPVFNHHEQTVRAVSVLNEKGVGDYLKEVIHTKPNNGAEDFGQYLLKIPGSFLNFGAMPESGEFYMNHHPKFDINESVLLVAAKAVGDIALDALSK